jgi:hypothetical protein
MSNEKYEPDDRSWTPPSKILLSFLNSSILTHGSRKSGRNLQILISLVI